MKTKSKYNVLIADDEDYSRMHLKDVIINKGGWINVFPASCTADALSVLEERKIDLIFLDIAISGASGLSIVRKAQEIVHKPSVIIVSYEAHIKLVQQAIKMGAIGYIRKAKKNGTLQLPPFFYNTSTEAPMLTNKDKLLIVENGKGIFLIPVSHILAVEKESQSGLTIYTRENVLKEVKNTLQRIEQICPDTFIYLSRQCMVNKTAISFIIPKSREIHIKVGNNETKQFICTRNKLRELISWLNSIAEK